MRRILVVYSGAGGGAEGYRRAGFEPVCVGIQPQPRNPFEYHRMDALDALAILLRGERLGRWLLRDFDAIHASPPCQRYSVASKSHNGRAAEHPDLVEPTRRLLKRTGLPYIIENVVGAPLVEPVLLCGTMFTGLRVIRHRLFECRGFELEAPPHPKHPLVYTRDKRKPHYGRLNEMEAFVQVTGGGNCSVAAARDAMGIDWMTKTELNDTVPPAYTEHVGRALLEHLSRTPAAESFARSIRRLYPEIPPVRRSSKSHDPSHHPRPALRLP